MGLSKEEAKNIGGAIPSNVYWKFKQEAAQRKESMQTALYNAILLYLEIGVDKEKDNG